MASQSQPGNPSAQLLPAIHRARIDVLRIYEISESELEFLERGSPQSIYLNFAIFLLSIALSFFIALVTTEIPSDRLFNVFVIVAALGFNIQRVMEKVHSTPVSR